MTPRGISSPLKDALLARFPHVRSAFNQTAFIESLNLSPQVLADIWLPVGFPPVSFEPLSEEEEKAAQSGQFINVNTRTRNSGAGGNNSNYSQTTGNGEYRNNPRGGPRQQHQSHQGLNRSRGGSFVSTSNNPRSKDFQDRGGYGNHRIEDDSIEDPENLWATPSNDTFGTSDFGTFDENGMFRAAGNSSILDGGLEDNFSASSTAFEGFMQTRHHHVAPPQPPVPAQLIPAAPLSPPVAIPHITPDTQWLYRDPSGQIQGPFPSHRMIEWYNGKYFPENLPLRREQDAFFEPLSTWKTKCAGQVPFIAYTDVKVQEPAVEKPLSFGTIHHAESSSVTQWFNEPEQPAVIKSTPAASIYVDAPIQTTRSLPIESLFSLPKPVAPEIEKPASPEVMMPTWKKLDKPSIAAKFGQMSLDTDVAEPLAPKTVATSASKSLETLSSKPLLSESAKPATSSWSNSPTASTGSLKKISLSEIMRSGEDPNIILEKEKPTSSVNATPVVSSANGSGWAKLSASPVQSLSSIQAEEASRQQSMAAASGLSSSTAAAAPSSKSFADLVRSAGVIQGNIVVSPSVIVGEPARPLTERKNSFSGQSGLNAVASSHSIDFSAPVTKPSASSTHLAKPQSTISQSNQSAPSLEDWCISSLKQSPSLSKSIDPQTCTILLMDLPNPSALLTFALETLKPLESGAFDLAAFSHDFSARKFGVKATEKVQWSKLKSAPIIKKQEESFETVKRKK